MQFPPLSWRPYMGRILCTLIGLAVGILLLTLGFWRTLLLVLVTSIGYFAGKWKDGAINPNNIPRSLTRWRG